MISDHHFKGEHWIATYKECRKVSEQDLQEAIAKALSHAKCNLTQELQIGSAKHGFCAIYAIISESHVIIHYEHATGNAFVDLFTCGETCYYKPFNEKLNELLQPKFIRQMAITRD